MSISLGRNAPLSPISIGGSDFSVSKYQPDDGPYPNGRSNLASPPNSGGSNSAMSINGFPNAPLNGPGPGPGPGQGPGPGPRSNGGPSPPASIARSSNGTQLYARSEGRNSVRGDLDEAVLSEHYVALRTFLNTRDPNHKQQPNKARDKLLRLSSVQFYELSTDVFDPKTVRRQGASECSKWSSHISDAREELPPQAKPGSPKTIFPWPSAIPRPGRRCLPRTRTQIPSLRWSRPCSYRKSHVNERTRHTDQW